MKTNREMTDSILQRASQIAHRQKIARKRLAGIIAGTLCLIIILGLTLAPWGSAEVGEHLIAMPTTQSTEATQDKTIIALENIYFLSAAEEGGSIISLQPDMTVPVNSMFRVRNLRGMKESEKEKAIEEEKQFKEEFKKQYGNSDGGWYSMSVLPEIIFENGQFKVYDGVIIQYLSGGKASLVLPNAEEIKSFDSETTGVLRVNGGYGTYNRDVTIGEGEGAVTIPGGSFRIYLHLYMGDEMFNTFKHHPDTPLSTLKDTITITVHYKNGTQGTAKIDVAVEDDGRVYMTMRGNSDV